VWMDFTINWNFDSGEKIAKGRCNSSWHDATTLNITTLNIMTQPNGLNVVAPNHSRSTQSSHSSWFLCSSCTSGSHCSGIPTTAAAEVADSASVAPAILALDDVAAAILQLLVCGSCY
jgi:hypothetical protein